MKEFYPLDFAMNGNNGKVTFGGRGVVENVDSLLMLGSEILRFPSFPEEVMQRECKSRRAVLKSADVGAGWKNGSFLFEIIYGDHPYGNIPYINKYRLYQITLADLIRFHKKYIRPDQIIISFFVDFDFDEIVSKIYKYFVHCQVP